MVEVVDIISEASVLKIGHVTSVEGRTIKVKVDREKNTSHLFFKGKLLKNVGVGSYLKITKGFERLVAKIEGEFVEEDVFQSRKQYKSDAAIIRRVLIVSLLGYFNDQNTFERGIKELPLIDNECFLLDEDEFRKVHNFVHKDDTPLQIGRLAQEKGMPIALGINGLFASHIGIFGNTGSGKSYTLAQLYRELFAKYKSRAQFKQNASFLLIDFNGEYINTSNRRDDNIIVEKAHKRTYQLSTRTATADKYPLPLEVIQDPLIWTVLLEATEKTQKPFIRNSLDSTFIDNQIQPDRFLHFVANIVSTLTLSKDKTLEKGLIGNFLKDIKDCSTQFDGIDAAIANFDNFLKYNNTLNTYYFERNNITTHASNTADFDAVIWEFISGITAPIANLNEIEKIRLKFVCNFYNDIVRGFQNREHIAPLINRLKSRIPDFLKVFAISTEEQPATDGANLTIVSLKDINIHMRKVLPLLLCKHLYEAKKKDQNPQKFLNLIIDEAHNILSESSQRESEQWKDYRLETFEEIIKEGRKFGVFITLASQRPSDISPTIVSQLHNYFLHRLINHNDIKAIEKTVSYLDKVSFDSLPILPTGTCILAGLVAQVPVIVEIDKIADANKPFNQTIQPADFW